jgi:DNA recombination protein RmuC
MYVAIPMEHLAITFSVVTLAAIVVLLVVVLRGRSKQQQPDQGSLMLQQGINALQQRLDAFGQRVSQNLQQTTDSMNSRLDKTAEVVGDLREKVGQIHEVGKAAQELVGIMRAPKLRGGMGEFFLGDLLAQILPREHYSLQYRFKSGDAVDAVIRIGPSLVPVDAKFPYENFKRVIEATAEVDRIAARKQFLRDVRNQVDAMPRNTSYRTKARMTLHSCTYPPKMSITRQSLRRMLLRTVNSSATRSTSG